jgi:hypothetical protein
MRARPLALALSCCALAAGCSGQSVERPATTAVVPAAAASTAVAAPPAVAKTPKRVATSEATFSLDLSAPTAGPPDVSSLNPVKMGTTTTTGGKFNPFAK